MCGSTRGVSRLRDPAHYDSMIATDRAWDTRERPWRGAGARDWSSSTGEDLPLQRAILDDQRFRSGNLSTRFRRVRAFVTVARRSSLFTKSPKPPLALPARAP